MTRRESIVESVRRSCVQGQHEARQLQRVVLVARVASQGQPAQQGSALESEVTAVNGSSTVDSDNDEHHDSHEGAANPKLRGHTVIESYMPTGDSAGSSLSGRGGQGGRVRGTR
jgi:hypothetical protein